MERGTVRVKCLNCPRAQQNVPGQGSNPDRSLQSVKHTNHKATLPPCLLLMFISWDEKGYYHRSFSRTAKFWLPLVLRARPPYARYNLWNSLPIDELENWCLITLPSRPRHLRIFAAFQSNIFDATSLFEINHVVHFNVPREVIFSVWRHDFFVLLVMLIHNMFIFKRKAYQVFSIWKNHSEFVLIIFYLQLINSGHADSSMADKNHNKLSSGR